MATFTNTVEPIEEQFGKHFPALTDPVNALTEFLNGGSSQPISPPPVPQLYAGFEPASPAELSTLLSKGKNITGMFYTNLEGELRTVSCHL